MSKTPEASFVPVVELDLDRGADVPAPNTIGEISMLVRLHQVPIGMVTYLPPEGGERVRRAAVWDAVAAEAAAHLRADGYDGEVTLDLLRASEEHCVYALPQGDQSVTVVVCTLGQDPRLRLTVASLLNQSIRELELVVVDNDPRSGRVRALLETVDDSRLRIVEEPRRGLSRARNVGLLQARGDTVAFTDDDAVADRDWLRQLIAPFDQDPRVKCTTGLVLPAELVTPSQILFEQYGAFDKGFQKKVWQVGQDLHTVPLATDGDHDSLFPFSPGVFGSGNNMAFRRRWLTAHGCFDPILGAGSSTRSGEDVDAFLKVLLSNELLVYVPQAVIRHFARSDIVGLRKQLFGYGIGMAATITKHLLSNLDTTRQVLLRLPVGVLRLLNPRSSKNSAKGRSYPRSLTLIEFVGYLIGPLMYLYARFRDQRQIGVRGASKPREDSSYSS